MLVFTNNVNIIEGKRRFVKGRNRKHRLNSVTTHKVATDPERSEGSRARLRPAAPPHVALGLVANHQIEIIDNREYVCYSFISQLTN